MKAKPVHELKDVRPQRGNVAVIFSLTSAAAVCLISATIELGRIASSKASLVAATDAAALAAKGEEVDKRDLGSELAREAAARSATQTFWASAPTKTQGVSNVSVGITWDADGSARVTARGHQDLMFGGVLGLSSIPLNATAVAAMDAVGDRALEVALVLDTTASMFEKDGRPTTRFTLMRVAAKNFVNRMFDTVTVPDRLRIAVIPWTTTINIRGEVPSQVWDNSAAPVRSTVDAGTRSLPAAPIDRSANLIESAATLNTQFAPVGWRGCISGNGESLTASDDAKAGMNWNAMLVPPRLDNGTVWKGVSVMGMCDKWTCTTPIPPPPKSPPPPPPTKTQGFLIPPKNPSSSFAFFGNLKTAVPATCVNNPYPCPVNSCPTGTPSFTNFYCLQSDVNGNRNTFFNFHGTRECLVAGGCQLQITTQLALGCVADYNEIAWNDAGGNWCSWTPKQTWDSFRRITGPNLNCPMPLLGLSANRTQVINTLDRLSPAPGGTHADVGLRWGLRALSPRTEWANFFQHKPPMEYGSGTVKKVMVLMTDGANEQAISFPGYWSCNDIGAPGCNGSPNRSTLDMRMQTWCSAIRETYKIELYTVAINVSDTEAINKLRTCAGDPNRAFAVDAADLAATFEKIAYDTSSGSPNLRIKQ
jgi:Flp pilus assembly protein TadG